MTARWPAEAPVLSDGVVTLRGLAPDDVDAVFVACQDPEIPRFTTVPRPYLREHAESFVNDLGAVRWSAERPDPDGGNDPVRHGVLAITDATLERLCGTIDLQRVDLASGTATVGYWMAAEERGRGLTTLALRLLMRWAFDDAGLEVVRWEAMRANEASRAVAEKVGFVIDGEGVCGDEPSWTATLTRERLG